MKAFIDVRSEGENGKVVITRYRGGFNLEKRLILLLRTLQIEPMVTDFSPNHLGKLGAEKLPFLIVLDDKKFELAYTLAQKFPLAIPIILADELAPNPLFRAFADYPALGTIVAADNGKLDALEFMNAVRRAMGNAKGGIESFLLPASDLMHHALIRDNRDEERLYEDITESFERVSIDVDVPLFKTYRTSATMCLSELISNGVFHANPRFQRDDIKSADKLLDHKSQDFKLSQQEAISVSWGLDGDRFAYCVKDPFGRLTRERLSETLRDLRRVTNKGSGMGLVNVVHNSQTVLIRVAPGRYTEVSGTLPLEALPGAFKRHTKTFQFVEEKAAQDLELSRAATM